MIHLQQHHTRQLHSMLCLFAFAAIWLSGTGHVCALEVREVADAADASEEAADVPDTRDATGQLPPHLADPEAYRLNAAKDKLCTAFAIKLEPEAGDALLDLLPDGTTAIELTNPGFAFTLNDGKDVPDKSSVHKIKRDQRSRINQEGETPGQCDPIKGWSAYGCAGLETTGEMHTPAQGATGYVLAHGKEHWLEQTLPGQLKPSTRYTFMVELFAHKNYKAPLPDDLIVRLVDGDAKHLDTVAADYDLTTTDPDSGFAVLLITLTTSADQAPGDLTIHLGINARGEYRANYDNARLWQQPMQP